MRSTTGIPRSNALPLTCGSVRSDAQRQARQIGGDVTLPVTLEGERINNALNDKV
jgi:hypothetical protein